MPKKTQSQGKATAQKTRTTSPISEKLRREIEHQRFTNIFENAPAFVCVLRGKKHIFELANKKYYQLIGERDIIGKSVEEALPEVVGQGFIEKLDTVLTNGKAVMGQEVKVVLKGKSKNTQDERFVNFIYQPIKEQDGSVTGIFVHGVDITEQVIARQKLEQLAHKIEVQAQTFDLTLTALQDFVYTFDRKGRFTYSNKPLLDLLGITLEEIMGKTFHDLPYPKELATQLHKQILTVIKTGKPITDETSYTNPAGVKGYYEYIFMPVFDAKKNVTMVAGSTRNITERKEIESAIKESEERFKTFAETMPQMAFSADSEGNITYYNQRWYDYVGGMKGTEGWGWMKKKIHHPDDLGKTVKAWKHSLKTGEEYEVEYRLRRHDGEYRWHLGRALPLRDEEGKITQWLGTNTDIHEQKKAVEQKDEFLGIASHELKTPVTSIKAYAQVLEAMFRKKG